MLARPPLMASKTDAGSTPAHQCLSRHGDVDRHNGLVGELGDVASADFADPDH